MLRSLHGLTASPFLTHYENSTISFPQFERVFCLTRVPPLVSDSLRYDSDATTPSEPKEPPCQCVSFPSRSLTFSPSILSFFVSVLPGTLGRRNHATVPHYLPATSRCSTLRRQAPNPKNEIVARNTSTRGLTSSRRLWKYSSNDHLQIFPPEYLSLHWLRPACFTLTQSAPVGPACT